MPELPEVETVVRTLRPQIVGQTIRSLWTSGQPLRMARKLDKDGLQETCVGATIRAVRRRGKYILIDLDSGSGVLVHLGMTGRLTVADEREEERIKHTHVVWTLPRQRELRFVDPRRFGWVQAAANLDRLPEIRALGPDPLTELDGEKLRALLAASRAPIKAFLLDQHRLAGLGNIYVCEALFRARIHPRTQARRARGKAEVLVGAIRETLEIGIANCGTSFRDFVDATGAPGKNIEALLVYGREGEACTACGRSGTPRSWMRAFDLLLRQLSEALEQAGIRRAGCRVALQAVGIGGHGIDAPTVGAEEGGLIGRLGVRSAVRSARPAPEPSHCEVMVAVICTPVSVVPCQSKVMLPEPSWFGRTRRSRLRLAVGRFTMS
jgi:formamidopyrimidine-DNA glycosylase